MENDPMSQPVNRAEFQTEIKTLVTKEDLKIFASKDDLNKYATKADIEKFVEKTNGEIRKLGDKIDRLAVSVTAIKVLADKKFNLIFTKIDKIIKVLDEMRTKKHQQITPL